MKIKACERCCCVDSEDNPIFEIVDEEGYIEERVCMDCFVAEIDNAEG